MQNFKNAMLPADEAIRQENIAYAKKYGYEIREDGTLREIPKAVPPSPPAQRIPWMNWIAFSGILYCASKSPAWLQLWLLLIVICGPFLRSAASRFIAG